MEKKRNAFLFGAGAMIDWNGPSTQNLTDLILMTGFPITDSEQRLTDYIYHKLIEAGYESDETNFETIINVIEELFVYYSEYNSTKQSPSLLRAFIGDDQLVKKFNFSIEGGIRKHGYKLLIPADKRDFSCNNSYNGENPIQFYLQHLLSEILSAISARISEYTYHTNNHSVIDIDSEISVNFLNWISSIKKNNILRMYSLNCDRVFKVLFESAKIDCFEGFYSTGEVSVMNGVRGDVIGVLEKINSNIFFNLHGSAFWKVLTHNHYQLPHPEIVYTDFPNSQVNSSLSNVQMERGKPLYLTNIITGYQKAQKSMVSPFKQMQATFDRDCLNANKIYIIGYSFGDEHINESIKIALRHNKKLTLEIVDPSFINNKLDQKLSLTIFQYIENVEINPKMIRENEYNYYDDKVSQGLYVDL